MKPITALAEWAHQPVRRKLGVPDFMLFLSQQSIEREQEEMLFFVGKFAKLDRSALRSILR